MYMRQNQHRDLIFSIVLWELFVAQVTEDLNTRKVLQTRETIITFTGRPPKDATHIEDLKHVIETFPHPNLEGVVRHQDTGGTIPVDTCVWEKLLDWHDLTTEQQDETKEFLLMRFSVDDLQLAWDEYYVQNGEIPNSIQYRIFINNWRAEMMRALEQKDDEIHRERDEHRLLHSQMDLVTHIYNGQLRHLQDVEQENDILRDTIHHMEDEDERKTQDNNHLREITEVQGRHVYQLRRTITEKDRQLCDKCSRLRELEDTKGEYESVMKRQKLMIKEKKDQVNEQSATINELKVENNEQSATINELKVENNEQSATVNDLIEQNHDRCKTINELAEENNNLKKNVDVKVYICQTKEEIIAEQSQIIEEQKAQLEEQRDMIKRYQDNDREIKEELAQQAIVNQDLYDQLEDVKKLCNKLMMKIQEKSQKQ